MKFTLDMIVPGTDMTLASAVKDLKAEGLVGLMTDEDEINESAIAFERAARHGGTATIGQVIAAWYLAKLEELEDAMYAEDSTMSNRSYGQRLAAIKRTVFSQI